jgi:hypothetical protein
MYSHLQQIVVVLLLSILLLYFFLNFLSKAKMYNLSEMSVNGWQSFLDSKKVCFCIPVKINMLLVTGTSKKECTVNKKHQGIGLMKWRFGGCNGIHYTTSDAAGNYSA